MLEKEGPESPPHDLSDAAVKEPAPTALRSAVTSLTTKSTRCFPRRRSKSEQIEDILAKFSEMGVHVVETDPELEVEVAAHEKPEEEAEGETS